MQEVLEVCRLIEPHSRRSGLHLDDLPLLRILPPTCQSVCSTDGGRDLRKQRQETGGGVTRGELSRYSSLCLTQSLQGKLVLITSVFLTFADRQEEVWIPRVKLELVDGISMTDVVLQVKTRGWDKK